MSEPGTTQINPTVSEVSASDVAAKLTASGSHPELLVDRSDSARNDPPRPPELGGPAGPEPTRYGDWERKGRCIDF